MGRKPDDEAANHLVWKDGFATSHDLKELGYRRHCPLAPVRTTELADPAGGEPTRWIEWCNSVIPVARFLDRPGFLVLHLAGIEPDPIVDSAAVAMHTCLRSILATCGDGVSVEFEKMRTALEVRQYMKARPFEYSHIILIGHGANDGIHLLDESPIAKDDFAELLGCADGCRQSQIVSLCCHSGCDDMASYLSHVASYEDAKFRTPALLAIPNGLMQAPSPCCDAKITHL